MYVRRKCVTLPGRDRRALARSNAHERDDRVLFDEGEHVYYVLDRSTSTHLCVERSVSGLIKVFLPETFDAEGSSVRLAKRARYDSKSPYYWLLQAQADPSDERGAQVIRAAWECSGSRSAEYGTECHLQLERAMNGEHLTAEQRNVHVRAALDWINARRDKDGWLPYRTEWSIFMDMRSEADGEDEDAQALQPRQNALLCGQLDALFVDPDGGYHLVDYKFTKPGKLDPNDGAQFAPNGVVPTGAWPVDDVQNNSYGHYRFQQSCYAYMLKRRYGIEVKSSCLLNVPIERRDATIAKAIEVPLGLLPDGVMRDVFVEAARKLA